jgi:hypothetical protein
MKKSQLISYSIIEELLDLPLRSGTDKDICFQNSNILVEFPAKAIK